MIADLDKRFVVLYGIDGAYKVGNFFVNHFHMFNIVRDFSRPPRKYKGFVSSTFKPEGKIAYVNLRASILIHTCNNIYNLNTGIIAEIPVKTRKTFLKQQDDHMKIALLGGSGFIGTEFIRQFGEQHDIFIGDIVKSTTYPERSAHCDIRRKDDLRAFMKGADVVINLAAVHRDDVRPLSLYHDTNVQGSQNICDVADELGIKHQIFTKMVPLMKAHRMNISICTGRPNQKQKIATTRGIAKAREKH